ncbi:MAG: oligopeptide ABC transporter ATP-binding protein OppF, partial [Chloroflexi bacterium]|nr:oligopeptide ABC transporter ATP-binding protein OppF [Chloroflexota bacterium]
MSQIAEKRQLPPDTLLDVRDLKVEFRLREGTVRAVNDISFRVKRGKTLGIIGESG